MHILARASRLALGFVAALSFGGCESANEFTSPSSSGGNDFAQFEAAVTTQAVASGIDLDSAPEPQPIQRSAGGGGGWVFVEGSAGDESVEAVVGRAGGVLNLGEHWLLIPANAVWAKTRFRMTPIDDGTLHVDLTATLVRRFGEVENDVGRAGFRRPVYLAFHYSAAGEAIDPASLAVAWLTDGELVVQETFIYEDAWAVGVLRHFSGYVLVGN